MLYANYFAEDFYQSFAISHFDRYQSISFSVSNNGIEDNALTLRYSISSYLPGSIVRICCQNFLTYDFVQFSPGARMNMILGPNGTGKSTIACAISIGLGFPTSVRAFISTDSLLSRDPRYSAGQPSCKHSSNTAMNKAT